jgi:hypothetical protein
VNNIEHCRLLATIAHFEYELIIQFRDDRFDITDHDETEGQKEGGERELRKKDDMSCDSLWNGQFSEKLKVYKSERFINPNTRCVMPLCDATV